MPRYAIHPGFVRSKHDGEEHYIGAARLAQLYDLRPNEWITWDENSMRRSYNDYVHLYPSYEGNYGRPDE